MARKNKQQSNKGSNAKGGAHNSNTTSKEGSTMAEATEQKEGKNKQADKAKIAKREANRKKREAKLVELKKKDPKKYLTVLNYKDAKGTIEYVNEAGETVKVENKSQFCEFRARALYDYWMQQAKAPAVSDKVLARKKARAEKLKNMLAELESELAELGGEDEDEAAE